MEHAVSRSMLCTREENVEAWWEMNVHWFKAL